ncbi:hypothetical protein HJFPF1_10895 [Paramyrothecium foliicola]|nr:hypothetical protein HJFPF1_10895 [Paramyrothecium foliicola]
MYRDVWFFAERIMPQYPNGRTCLGIAVDHRVTRLYKRCDLFQNDDSNHVQLITKRGEKLQKDNAEVEVTAQLAGPAKKGGIVVVLQQPRDNHRYAEGSEAVINDCQTLSALRDMFKAVSCGTLDINRDISIIDILSYLPQNVAEIDDAMLGKHFGLSPRSSRKEEFEEYQAEFGQYQDKDNERETEYNKAKREFDKDQRQFRKRKIELDKLKGEVYKLESIGLGKRFGVEPKRPIRSRIRSGPHELISVPRINGFHPSSALNHQPHVSRLRQLQLLIAAEACGASRHDWEEEEWMDHLRARCQDTPVSDTCRYVPEYQELYSDTLRKLQSLACGLMSDQLENTVPSLAYKKILESGITEHCNDASLTLCQMAALQLRGWPERYNQVNLMAISKVEFDTSSFQHQIRRAAGTCSETKLAAKLMNGMKLIESCFKAVTGLDGDDDDDDDLFWELDFSEASDAFLDLAVSLETLLEDLLQQKEVALKALGQEELLSSLMGKMRLARPMPGKAN